MKHRSLAALLALLVCLAFLPSPAYAIDIWPNGTIYEEDTDTHHNWFGRADSVYDAAVYAMGHSPSELTDEMRLMLSDPVYGGDFYSYALSFYHVDGWFDIPSFVPTYALGTIGLVQDFDRVYASTRSISSFDAAFQDFLRILHGEIPDVGTTPDPTTNGFVATLTDDNGFVYEYGNYPWFSMDGNTYYVTDCSYNGVSHTRNAPETVKFFFSQGLYNSYLGLVTEHPDLKLYIVAQPYNGGLSATFFLTNQVPSVSVSSRHKLTLTWSYSSSYLYYGMDASSPLGYKTPASYDSSLGGFVIDYTAFRRVTRSFYSTLKASYDWDCYFYNGSAVVPPPDPDGDWPSDSGVSVPAPVVPDPDPEPSISGTVVVAPSVTWPDIDITINNNDPENTTPADYTPWFQAINASLNSLRSDLLVEFDAVQQSIRNIYYYLQHLDTILESHCVHIRNQIIDSTNHLELYLRDLVHWLAEQLDYDANVDLDDNAIIAYLTQISSKMGGGTYEPNPISNEDSYYAWLDDLWDRFLLGDNWESSAQSISSSFSQLTTRFPFSIPWDIVALFRLFVHDPVTPVFDLPLFFSSDSYAPVHVDLSGWDGVASMVRPVIYVIFALKLALLSRDLLAGFGADKGGL